MVHHWRFGAKDNFDRVNAEQDVKLSETFRFEDTITTAVNTILKCRLQRTFIELLYAMTLLASERMISIDPIQAELEATLKIFHPRPSWKLPIHEMENVCVRLCGTHVGLDRY